MRFARKKRCTTIVCGVMVVAAALAGGVATGSRTLLADETDSAAAKEGDQAQAGARALSREFRFAARKASPAVVTILSYGQNVDPSDDSQEVPNGGNVDPTKQLTGLGSGVIVSENGMVITNNHVIADAKRVVVQLYDETEIEATNVHGDPDSDIATLQITREEPFEYAEIGDSDGLEIGDWVLAIGSPFRLEATVSAGIISAKNRTLQRIRRGRLLQTDAAINPGNSGGPLIDLDGRVIAISTAIATRNGGYQGVGFAIPIKQAKWIADDLTEHGKVRRAAIGIQMVELNPKNAARFRRPPNLGVLAYAVINGSAAERAGIKPLDVILEFAGERVRDPGDLQEAIERMPIGSVQDVKVDRKGKEVTLKVELAPLDDTTAGTKTTIKQSQTTARPKRIDEDGQTADISKSEQAGFDSHVTKPVDPDELLTILNSL